MGLAGDIGPGSTFPSVAETVLAAPPISLLAVSTCELASGRHSTSRLDSGLTSTLNVAAESRKSAVPAAQSLRLSSGSRSGNMDCETVVDRALTSSVGSGGTIDNGNSLG